MSNKIYAGNLSFSILEEVLKDAFKKFGNVTSCRIITDRGTGQSKGFGFIEMESSHEAKKAIDGLNGIEFEGRSMRVNEAKPPVSRERSFVSDRW